jgi:hypothetical protein
MSEEYVFRKRVVNNGVAIVSKECFPVPTDANQVFGVGGFQSASQYKAYASVEWKANSTATTLAQNTWTKISTGVAPALGVTSGHVQANLVSGESDKYEYQYVDPTNNLTRVCSCHARLGVDFSTGGAKDLEFRLVVNGAPEAAFWDETNDSNCEAIVYDKILSLAPDDVIEYEIRNTSDSNNVTVKYFTLILFEL